MTIQAQTPDGTIHEFPDGTPDGVVDDAIKSYLTPSLGSQIKSDVSKDWNSAKSGLQDSNPLMAGLDTVGSLYKIPADITSDVIQKIPGYSTAANAAGNAAQSGAQKIANAIDSPATEQAAIDAGQVGNSLNQNHPNIVKGAQDIGNIIAGSGTIAGAVDGASLIGKGANAAASLGEENASRNIFANNQSGDNFPLKPRPYDDIKSANNALSSNTSSAYEKAHQLGVVLSPDASDAAAQTLRNDVGTVDPGLHPKTIGALNIFDKKAESGLNLESIDNTRKQLGRIAYDSNAGAEDIYAAKQGIKSIDKMLDGIESNPAALTGGTADAVPAIKAARAASALEQNHSDIAEMLRQANGNPNAIQSKFKDLFDDTDSLSRFTPDQQNAIKILAHPTGINKALETVGKAGFMGSGTTVPVFESGSSLTALALGNPITAAAIAAPVVAGTAANAIRAQVVRGMADNILKDIESKSVPVQPVDPTLGNKGFSPVPSQKLLPAPPNYYTNKVGTTAPAPIPNSVSPISEVKSPVAGIGAPDSGGVDVRGSQMRGGSELGQFAAQNAGVPIKQFQNATSMEQVGSKVHNPEYDAAVSTLQNLASGKKRGGAVITPRQRVSVNKLVKKTQAGRAA